MSKFIVLEGIDGCGKTTQSKLLSRFLSSKGFEVVLTREPTDGEIGKLIKEKYLKEESSPLVDALLFSADREEHLKKTVIPALNQGKIVVSDRYYHSTLAYQSAQGVELEWLLNLNKNFIKPDLTLIIDVEAKKAMERIECDERRDEKKKFEKVEFLEKVRGNFLRLKEILRDENIVIVDGSKNEREVFELVKREVEKLIL